MSLFSACKKYWIILVISLSLFFVFGYKVGKLVSKPERIWLGERYVLKGRYDLNVFYGVEGRLMGLALHDISNDYARLGSIDFHPSGYVGCVSRPTQNGWIWELFYENGNTRTIVKRNVIPGKEEKITYSENGDLLKRTVENIDETPIFLKDGSPGGTNEDVHRDYDPKRALKGSPPASYIDYLYFQYSPWDIRNNWYTARSKGHIYKYLSAGISNFVILYIMLLAIGIPCIIVLHKKQIFVKCCTIVVCVFINLLMGFIMSWDLYLFHKVQARADLLSDSSACGIVSLYIGVCYAIAGIILPLILLISKGLMIRMGLLKTTKIQPG